MTKVNQVWNEELGTARTIIHYHTKAGVEILGIGYAECHSDDIDFKSKRTGLMISDYRAEIDLIKGINRYEIRPSIAALKHVYCTMRNSKHFNENSYEAIRLKKELAHLMDEYEENKQLSVELKQNLKTYIDEKEAFYTRLRQGQN